MKEELFYSRNDKSENYTIEELKTMIWRYYMSYWATHPCKVSESVQELIYFNLLLIRIDFI